MAPEPVNGECPTFQSRSRLLSESTENPDTPSSLILCDQQGEGVRCPWRHRPAVWLLLAVATMAAHGWSLGDGLFLDDHWHQARLREMGWSLGELLEATTIDPNWFIDTWWQERSICWRYSRPVSVVLMKTVHHVSSGSVAAHHAVSLVLHFLVACMVHQLCWLLTRNRFWPVVGGLLFVVYSHGVFAVSWLAAQNVVLQTALMLAALLCYICASGLDVSPPAAHGADQNQDGSRATPGTADAAPPNLKGGLFVWTIVLWSLALFSRENAIMLPVIMAAFDLAFGGRRHVWARRRVYLVVGALAVAFLYWRLMIFYHPMPDVYARRAGVEGYWLWCLVKLMHYVCSSVWLSPMTVGPTGRITPIHEVPGDCLLMLGVLAVMGVGYYQACRNARGYWIWPLWLVLAVLPVVPLLATPHTGYLCGVGFAVAMVLGPGLGRAIKWVGMGKWCRPVALWFLVATCVYIPIYRTLWRGIMAAERYTIAEMAAEPPPEGVTDAFFLNLPFVNIYSQICLTEVWGGAMSDVRCHVLTYSPVLLRMEQPCRLTQLDEHSFSISVEGRPYFSGLLGRFLIDGLRDGGPFKTGQVIAGEHFDVRILQTDTEGVRELLFTFHQPLASDRYRFYLTTRECGALRLTFVGPDGGQRPPAPVEATTLSLHNVASAAGRLSLGESTAAEVLFAAMELEDQELRRRAWAAFVKVAAPIARATGASMQDVLVGEQPPADRSRVYKWWRRSVDDRLLDRVWVHRDDFTAIRHTRDALFNVRSITADIIKTDLYLTGPPFPGPR